MVNKLDTQFLIEGSNLDEDDIRAGIMASAEGDCLNPNRNNPQQSDTRKDVTL